MKTKWILFFATCLTQLIQAQSLDSIKINSRTQEFVYQHHAISAATNITQVQQWLGQPSRVEQVSGKDRYFIYDGLGISFDAGKSGQIEAVIINYNFDGDKKAAKEKYTGALVVDNFSISEKTKTDEIKQFTRIKAIVCMGPTLCVSDPKSQTMALVVGYTQASLITQIVFGFTGI